MDKNLPKITIFVDISVNNYGNLAEDKEFVYR